MNHGYSSLEATVFLTSIIAVIINVKVVQRAERNASFDMYEVTIDTEQGAGGTCL
jgi:hypothetical protein